MGTVSTHIRIDEDLKKQAAELFNKLGIDMSSAVTMFLKQAVLNDGLPFKVELPKKSENIEEAKVIDKNQNVKFYTYEK